MNRLWPRLLKCFCWGWCSLFVASLLDGAEPAQERFLKEAPQKWLEYRKLVASHTEGTCRMTDSNCLGKKEVVASSEASFALGLDQQGVRLIARDSIYTSNEHTEEGRACNRKYSFSVARATADDKWVITGLKASTPFAAPDDLIGTTKGYSLLGGDGTFVSAIGFACLGLKIWNAWLPMLVASQDFKVVRVSELGGNSHLVRVEFTFEPKGKTGGSAPGRSGVIILDPGRYWLLSRAETSAKFSFGRGALVVANEFSSYSDGTLSIPYVSHQVLRVSAPKAIKDKPWEEQYVSEVTLSELEDRDEKQFALSYFGLPEPSLGGRKWAFRICLALTTVLVFVLICLTWRYKRRSMPA